MQPTACEATSQLLFEVEDEPGKESTIQTPGTLTTLDFAPTKNNIVDCGPGLRNLHM